MKVISTNIAQPRMVQWKGKLVQTGIYKEPTEKALELGYEDVVGDSVIDRKFHGGEDKACYLYSADHYPFWKEKYPGLDWNYGMFGENLTIEGLDERKLFIGDIYSLGTAKVQISQPRQPCFKLGIKFEDPKIIKEFIAIPFSGTYIKVIEPGIVNIGDEFIPLETKRSELSIADVFMILYHSNSENDRIDLVMNNPYLPESTKKDIAKRHRK